MDYSYLSDILILFTAAVAVVVVLLRLRLPPILGYLFVGVLMGPYGFALIANTEHTRAFAEFGVVFLLFTIGLEFSLPLLIRMKGSVLGLGASQVLLSTAITAAVSMYLGMSLESAVVLGGVVAMSSTALVTRQLTDQVELHSRHGRNAMGILLFQDIMVVPFLILVANLSNVTGDTHALTLVDALAKGVLALLVILALGRWVLRPLFRGVARFRSTEVFTLTALLVILGAAWITQQLGLSLALGAFIAGMMLGETEFRHQVEAEIRPFRDVLLGLFFITIGMLLNVQLLPEVWAWVLLLLTALILIKMLLVTGLCHLAGWNNAVALRTGLVLAHGGEFGFAILAMALSANIIRPEYGQVVLAALLISMVLAPLAIRFNGRLAAMILPSGSKISRATIREQVAGTVHGLSGHVIICGYGRVGQNIARFLEDEGINFIAMDLDPVLVQNAVKAKEPVTYGDAASLELLEAAGLRQAAALVISLNDVSTSLKILHNVRHSNTELPILVRTADDSQLERLQEAGATEVIPETMESSLMMASHLLIMLKVPVSRVFNKIRRIRNDRYALLRRLFPGEETAVVTPGDDMEQLQAIELPENAWPVQCRIADLGLENLGITITAMHRQGHRILNPAADTVLLAGDVLILYGAPSSLEQAETVLLRELSETE
ncbi:MAG: monovalent cation:proton antiporter family protein [Gammaproteobacteria bacterium]|nr:MAG: monovalent cation:proton antiporter family protein [Gammaproteobacteria bacterium]